MRRRSMSLAATSFALALAAPAGAHDLTPDPTKVTAVSASRGVGSVQVSGTAVFGGQRLLSIGTDPANDGGAAAVAMYDLIGAKLGQLDISTGDFTFVFKLRDLLFAGSVPEAARYTWDFGIQLPDGSEPVLLQVDGKYTDVVTRQSTAIPTFVLRGNCRADANDVIGCTDVATLTTEFISTDNEIFVDVPWTVMADQLKERYPDAVLAGAEIVRAQISHGIGVHPSAYYSLDQLGDTLLAESAYRVAYRRVRVGIAPLGGTPAEMVDATLTGGSFNASLDTSALAPGSYTILAQACYGTNCGTKSTFVTI